VHCETSKSRRGDGPGSPSCKKMTNPTQDTVLFDGQCNFCRSQIDLLKRLDGQQRLSFVSFHEPEIASRYPDLSFEQLMAQMWIITNTDQRYGGAYAVRYLTRRLPILWPLAPLMHIPFSMPLWQFLYKLVAKYRYKIAGRNCDEGGTCSLHHTSGAASKTPSV
jgi:predicted DCC family thiol-disulfide oxidoreductase YuxK